MTNPEETTVQVKKRRNRLWEILGPTWLAEHRQGLTAKAIAEKTDVSEQTVVKFLLSKNLIPNGNQPRDEMTKSETMIPQILLHGTSIQRPEDSVQKPVSETLDLNSKVATPEETSNNDTETSHPIGDAPFKDAIKGDAQPEIYLVWPELHVVFHHAPKSAVGFVKHSNSDVKIERSGST